MLHKTRQAQAVEFGVDEADVEAGVVNHDLGARHEGQQLLGHCREERLVGQEVVGDAVHAHRVRVAGALRVDVVVQAAAGVAPVDHLDAADLDDAVALGGVQAGRFGVQEDLSHGVYRSGAASRPSHHHSSAPAATIGRHSHWPMLMPSASRPRKLSGSRKYSATKRSTP